MNCLKCGRTVPEGTLLCTECLSAKKAPVRTEPEPLQEELQAQQIEKLSRSRRKLRRWVAALVVLCILGLAVLGAAGYYLYRQNSRISAQASRINSLETVVEELKGELEQSNATADALRDSIASEQELIGVYESYTGLSPDEIITAAQTPDEQP